LEVVRIYRDLLNEDSTWPESGFSFYLDDSAPILRRLESFTDEPLRAAIKDHEKRAAMVLDLEQRVGATVKRLKERGLISPYLRAFVVARINPLRWIKGEPPPLEDVLKTMRERAARFNVENIKPQDLAGAAVPSNEEP
jgi:ParB family chromosome partitioning protein